MTGLLAALGLLRREELRAELLAELAAATAWEVRALASPGMYVHVGPHRLGLPPSHPALGTMHTITAALVNGHVRPHIVHGVPSPSPRPTTLPAGTGVPLAWVHLHAGALTVHQHQIARCARSEAGQP